MDALAHPRARGAAAKMGSRESPDLQRLLKTLLSRELTPAIVFAFSRKECEGAAVCARDMPLLPDEQLATVRTVFEAAVATLSTEDQGLQQIQMMLPLLKEIVELLFQESLVRLLFATETFSMGVNMPARTVVFTSLRKYDGEQFRMPTAAEYTQMSGRAGRRGIDERGMVVLCLTEEVEEAEICRRVTVEER